MPSRLIYVRRATFPSRAANAINTFRLCEALGSSGVEVTLVIPKTVCGNEELYDYYGVSTVFSIIQVPSSYRGKGGQLFLAYRLSQEVKKMGASTVYGRDIYTLWFLSMMGVEVFLDAHSPPRRGGWKGGLIASLFKSKYLRGVTIISEALRPLFEREGVPTDNIHLVRNAAREYAGASNFTPFRKDSGRFTVGYTGHLYQGRGIDLILEVAQCLPDVDFIFIGGTAEDISYWKEQGATPNVTFMGFIPPEDVPRQIIRFDALLAPYQREVLVSDGKTNSVSYMSPVKLFEYMASGVPIVTSRLPAIEEFLDSSIAMLCSPDKVEDWVEAINTLKDQPTLGTEMAKNALEEFRGKYSWKRRVDRLVEIFND